MSEKFTIDLTPTWEGILPIFILALEAGTENKGLAKSELLRMAKLADKYSDMVKRERSEMGLDKK